MLNAFDVGDALPPVPADTRFDKAFNILCIPCVDTFPTERTGKPVETPLTRTLSALTLFETVLTRVSTEVIATETTDTCEESAETCWLKAECAWLNTDTCCEITDTA